MNHKKIAELANVSASTVSKALSGSSEISHEVSEKIRQIAIECGYFKEKNKRKREYRNNKSMLIAVLVPELLGGHYSEIVTYIKNEIESKGAYIAIYVYDFDKNKMNEILKKIILSGAVDGIMMFCKPDLTIEPNIPIVCFSPEAAGSYDSIGNDTFAIMNDCIRYFKGLGHTKIAFVGEFNTIMARDAFVAGMKKNNLVCSDELIYVINERLEAIGIEAAKRISVQKNKPTAVIAAYDVIALSLIHELNRNNIQVPEDISVMGINNISSSAYAQIPLTTVDTFSAEQYRTAVEILFDKITNETSAVKHITAEHKIIARSSTKKLNK